MQLMLTPSSCTEKVQVEIDSVIGQSKQPSLDDRVNLPYTDAVIHEIQRMANIVPLSLPHITTKDLHVEGYTVPKVSCYTCILYASHALLCCLCVNLFF